MDWIKNSIMLVYFFPVIQIEGDFDIKSFSLPGSLYLGPYPYSFPAANIASCCSVEFGI
jgi:hypothetical protein